MEIKIEHEVTFMSLDMDEQQNYVEIREQVRAIQAQNNGLELLLNAIIATGSETTLDEVREWVAGVEEQGINNRDLPGFCHDPARLITVESNLVGY